MLPPVPPPPPLPAATGGDQRADEACRRREAAGTCAVRRAGRPAASRRRCCMRSSASRARVSERKLASSQRWTSCSRVFWYQASVSFDHLARVADELLVLVGDHRAEPLEVHVRQGRARAASGSPATRRNCIARRARWIDDRRRAAQPRREPDPGQRADDPLARVPLPPADAVPVVVGELVVEVVVALAVGQEGEPAVVARAVLVAVGLAAEGVRERN